ncbi:hypothetical protein WR25_25612 [Diploscapter pachys]|uniref:non-specific serine/threonine protein kinase n=1 Tax=Diploscapter pachys TaxID=2018661 RepID=A0A2A2LL53_9BILA|nr:hypothetical protein WR25_25612 [Diploscapter pachys]
MAEDGLIPENMRPTSSSNYVNPDAQVDEHGNRMKTMTDYEVLKEIGEGSFSVVYAAREKAGQKREAAIKTCFKKQIIKLGKVASVFREKRVLQTLSEAESCSPFIVQLMATFQDESHLYFVLSYAKYGDLLQVQMKQPGRKFTKEETKFYAAELWMALSDLAHIHGHDFVHLDVKLENILVKSDGHTMLSDFGCVKDLNEKDEKLDPRIRHSAIMPGTAQYVSPEILQRDPVTPSCDIWAFGVVIYQLLTGKHCFHDESEYLIFKRIQKLLYKFPDDFPEDAKDLVEKILVLQPTERLGAVENGGGEAVTKHSFFEGVDWDKLHETQPPITLE